MRGAIRVLVRQFTKLCGVTSNLRLVAFENFNSFFFGTSDRILFDNGSVWVNDRSGPMIRRGVPLSNWLDVCYPDA
jgi:hypothetical protein